MDGGSSGEVAAPAVVAAESVFKATLCDTWFTLKS